MSVEKKVYVTFEALTKELRCPICLCILNHTQIQSRRHVRKDAACDAFIKALNLRAIQKQMESENPQQITPFHLKLKKKESQKKPKPPIIEKTDHELEDRDIEMTPAMDDAKESETVSDEVASAYMDVAEYLIRFEPWRPNHDSPHGTNTQSNVQWESWSKASDLLFLIKQVVCKKMGKENSDMSVRLYCNKREIESGYLAELRVIMSRFYTLKEHNDIVTLQQKALQKYDKTRERVKIKEYLHGGLGSGDSDTDGPYGTIPYSTNSVAKPFVFFYKLEPRQS